MTKYVVVSVRDQTADTFQLPFVTPNVGVAVRSFADAVQNPEPANPWNKHPEDFSLWLLGEFDDETGKITPVEKVQLGLAKEYVRVSS